MKIFLFIVSLLALPLSVQAMGRGRPKEKIPFTEINQAFDYQFTQGRFIGDCDIEKFEYTKAGEGAKERIWGQIYERRAGQRQFFSLYVADKRDSQQTIQVIPLADGWKELSTVVQTKGFCMGPIFCYPATEDTVELRFHPQKGVSFMYGRNKEKGGGHPDTDVQWSCGQRN